ncbi:MAG: hypothetical protein EOO29_12780, partial [Comamonadaceae bacterium]
GELAEKFVHAQFSQSQESAADDYSFDLLTERRLERKGLITGFEKLAKLSGGSSGPSLMSSHPPSSERAARMQKRLDAAGPTPTAAAAPAAAVKAAPKKAATTKAVQKK